MFILLSVIGQGLPTHKYCTCGTLDLHSWVRCGGCASAVQSQREMTQWVPALPGRGGSTPCCLGMCFMAAWQISLGTCSYYSRNQDRWENWLAERKEKRKKKKNLEEVTWSHLFPNLNFNMKTVFVGCHAAVSVQPPCRNIVSISII